MKRAMVGLVLAGGLAGLASATELSDKIATKYKVTGQDSWYDCRRTVFDFDGYEAWVVEPKAGVKLAEGKPWTWTMQWATAFVERTGVPRLVNQFGWRHATVITHKHRMDEEGLAVSRRFQKFLVEELGFAPKANLIGMSWGGFYSVRYAVRYPDCVARAYLDAPLLTYWDVAPGEHQKIGVGPWEESAPADGKWTADPRMPVNMAEQLAKAEIPVFIVYGGQDTSAPPVQNAIPFIERFKKAGGEHNLEVLYRPYFGHHPHGFELNERTHLDFFLDRKTKDMNAAFERLAATVHGGERTATFLHAAGKLEQPWLKDVPDCAVVEFTLKPTVESEIHCRLFLPPPTKWNGRFWGIGNTALGNTLDPLHIPAFHIPRLREGAATCEADMGTADGRHGREVVRDFGWRAHHLMCVEAKKMIAEFYGRPAKKNYFYGVSSGGGQGLHEAQRFPEDYDGIVCYVPAHYRTKLAELGRAAFRQGRKRDTKGFMSQVLYGKDAKGEYDMDDAEFAAFLEEIRPDVDASSTDLDAFVRRGGKLMIVSGLADKIVPSETAREYCEALAKRYGGVEKIDPFFRAYFLPGRGHTKAESATGVEDIPAAESMVSWVERGIAPGRQRGIRKDGQVSGVSPWNGKCAAGVGVCGGVDRIPLERLFEIEAPIDRWVDAVPLGNGQAGALLWGGGDELRFTLDRADYWHVERNPMLDDAGATWNALTAQTNDMKALLARYVVRKDPCKLPGVRLVAKLADGAVCRKFTLNARNGSAEILLDTKRGLRRLQAWFEDDSPYLSLSLPADVSFASLHFTTNAAFAVLGGYPEPAVDISAKGAFYRRGNRAGAKGRWTRDFAAGVKFVRDGSVCDSAFWNDYWKVSDVALPDVRLQKFYDFAMYSYGAASRPGCAPIALQAVWTTDNGSFPPWHGDYHMDLNVQETYWAAPVAGHLDQLDAYAFHLTELLPAFEDYGRAFFGLTGGAAAIPGHMAYDGTFIAGGPIWALPLSHGLWGFAEVFNAWDYCPTRERLERIWPLGLALAKAVDQVLLPPDEKGVRRYALSGSPELGTDGQIGESRIESFLRPNTTYDRAVTRGFLKQVAVLAAARGSVKEETWLLDLAKSLGPANVDEKGRYLIAPEMPLPNSHLHLSHLHDIFPYKDVDAEADARASVEQYLGFGKSGWAGHTLPEAACKCACVGLGDEALKCLEEFATQFTARNGFHLNYWYRDAVRRDREPNDVFTLEANLAFARGVQELLLGGERGRIRLFPALPAAWNGRRVAFRDLLVPGGHRVTAVREPDGRIHGEITGFSEASVDLVFPGGCRQRVSLCRGRTESFLHEP